MRIGTRGSQLALAQTHWVIARLREHFPGLSMEVIPIQTTGDRFGETPIPQVDRPSRPQKDLFTKELEEALFAGAIDVAIHSLKDLTSELPTGLTLGAVTQREDPRDCLVSREGLPFRELPVGSVIGTSAFRRRVQLLQLRSDICITDLRGNLDTRLRKVREGRCDAIVVALAGVKRLHREGEVTEVFGLDELIPAVGQGSLALEVRVGDGEVSRYAAVLDHQPSRQAARAERAFLLRMGGGCRVPLGAYAGVRVQSSEMAGGAEERLHIRGFIADLQGHQVLTSSCQGSPDQPEEVGRQLAEQLVAQGADKIMAAI